MFTVSEILEATQGKLIRGNPNAIVTNISIDSRTIKKKDAFIAILGKQFDGHQFITDAINRGAETIIVHKIENTLEQATNVILVSNTKDALLQLASYYRQKFPVRVIAISGSNGKTTTKEMAAHILAQNFQVVKAPNSFNNDIGVPLTLFQIRPETEIVVLEMEMNEPGGITKLAQIAMPEIGVITNIGDTHLEFLKDRQGVAKEKQELLEVISEHGSVVLNRDDPWVVKIARPFRFYKKLFFGIKSKKGDLWAERIMSLSEDGIECLINGKYFLRLKIPGIYNIYNALAAIGVGVLLDLKISDMVDNLANFIPPSMRMEKITLLNGITIFNDAYNANPQSMLAALFAFSNFSTSGRKIAVLGDMCELGAQTISLHQLVGKEFPNGIDILVTVGKYAHYIGQEAQKKNLALQIYKCCDLNDVYNNLVDIFKNNDKILIKGSRAMKMETIVEKLITRYGRKTN
ncbi:MAG: UDP-N-acetylmuramoyl-tripeptide--D-alanyl-D-alanine ligase [candidate division WOR-3 bacterium]